MKKYVMDLEKIRKEDLPRAGGKAANLGEMLGAGLPVPGGFVVLTSGYRHFIQENRLDDRIKGLVQGLAADQVQELDQAAGEIARLIDQAPVPAPLQQEIEAAYGALEEKTVVVRSSATAEDLPGMSFAGQYDSFLNIRGQEALLAAIKKCWASLWNGRAVSYRLRYGLGNDELAHGVVVQGMIQGEVSGILFTANPVNGRRDHMLLNASWGLGEAIVGGKVTPDQWIIGSGDQVVEESINRKETMTIRTPQGTTEVPVPAEKRREPSLDHRQVQMLARLGRQTQEWFGSPQDLEWAIQGDRCYLVQTRPITSLYPLPRPTGGQEDLRIFINISLISQGIQEPLTPMGENVFLNTYAGPARMFDRRIKDVSDLGWCQSIGGRVFIDYTGLLRDEKKWEKFIINDYFSDQDPLSAKALLQWLRQNKEEITRHKDMMFPWLLKNLVPCLKIAWPMASATLYGQVFPHQARAKALREWEEILIKAQGESKNLKTIPEKLDYIERQVGSYTISGFGILSYLAPSFKNVEKVEKMVGRYLGDTSDLKLVEKSLPHNVTTEMGVELMQIARELDERGEKPSLEDKRIQEFFARYGHRSVQEMDIGIPRWDEEPGYVLGLIQSYIDHQSYQQGLDKFFQGQKDAGAAIERITRKVQGAKGKKAAQKVEKLLQDYREIFGLREESKFVLTQLLHIFRKLLIEIGEELETQGRLEDKMDVFFVRIADIKSGEKLQEKVKANKETHTRHSNLNAPRLLASNGESIFAAAEEKEGALTGIPVSAGVYQGKARILNSPGEGSKLEKGEILVTRGTNPAWTPLFLNLGAIVMETGGPISHGAVVAREYGVPAVVGVGEATHKIKDGQIIRVNGESGQVELLDMLEDIPA